MSYKIESSIKELKAQQFNWFEYKAREDLSMGSSKGTSLNLTKGIKFGIKENKEKNQLVLLYDLDRSYTISEDVLSVIKSKSKPSQYAEVSEEVLEFFQYHEISNVDKKAFTKMLYELSKLREQSDQIYGMVHSRKRLTEADEYKMEKEEEKIERKINTLNNKFNVRFNNFLKSIKKEDFKLSNLSVEGLNPEDEKQIDFYLKEFLKKPIVDKSPAQRKR